jgi:hypothetical protein
VIDARRRSYEALAHCTLQVTSLRDAALDAGAFLNLIQAKTGNAR